MAFRQRNFKRKFLRPRQNAGRMYVDMNSLNCDHEKFVKSLEKPILLKEFCSDNNKLMGSYTEQNVFDENLQKCYERAKGTTKPEKEINMEDLLPEILNTNQGNSHSKKSNTARYLNRDLLHKVLTQIPNIRDIYDPDVVLQGHFCREGSSPLTKKDSNLSIFKFECSKATKLRSCLKSKPKILICCPRSGGVVNKAIDTPQVYKVNYDNLYTKLMAFFERTCDTDSLQNIYSKCCMPLVLQSKGTDPYVQTERTEYKIEKRLKVSRGSKERTDGESENGGQKSDGKEKKRAAENENVGKGRKKVTVPVPVSEEKGSENGPKTGTDKETAAPKVRTEGPGKGAAKAGTEGPGKGAAKGGTDGTGKDTAKGGKVGESTEKGATKGDTVSTGKESKKDVKDGEVGKGKGSAKSEEDTKSTGKGKSNKSEKSEKSSTGDRAKEKSEDERRKLLDSKWAEDQKKEQLRGNKFEDSETGRGKDVIRESFKRSIDDTGYNLSVKNSFNFNPNPRYSKHHHTDHQDGTAGEIAGEMVAEDSRTEGTWEESNDGTSKDEDSKIKKPEEGKIEKKRKPKKKVKKEKKEIVIEEKIPEEPPKPCDCPICIFMKRRKLEPVTPLIKAMREEHERRELKTYYIKMKIAEGSTCPEKQFNLPQHKVDPIVCHSNTFCNDKRIQECMDCFRDLEILQQLLDDDEHQLKHSCLLLELKKIKQKLEEL